MNCRAEREIKVAYLKYIANYVADTIKINYYYNKDNNVSSFNQIYYSAFDTIQIDKKEKRELYRSIERILKAKYRLIRTNSGYNTPLVLKEIER